MTAHTNHNAPVLPADLVNRLKVTIGLRALAVFLEANPDVPVESWGWKLQVTLGVSKNGDTDRAQRAEVDRVAKLLGVAPQTKLGDHYTASRTFGSVTYEIVHVPAREMAAFHARDSYRDNITLDSSPDQTPGAEAA